MKDYEFLYIAMMGVQIIVSAIAIIFNINSNSKIEELKRSFAKEQANRQSELDILKDRKGKNFTQAQQAIIDFHKQVSFSASKLMELQPIYHNVPKMEDFIVLVNELEPKAQSAANLLHLLVEDDSLVNTAYDLLLILTNLKSVVVNDLTKLLARGKQLKREYDKLDRGEYTIAEIYDKTDDLHKEFENLKAIMLTNRIKRHAQFAEVHSSFIKAAKLYLT